MYFEETEWCWKAKQKGYCALSLPGTTILHKGRVSLSGNNELYVYMFERNRIIFARSCMKPIQYFIFIIYDSLKYTYRAYLDKVPLKQYMKPHLDGLFNRVDYSVFNIPNAVWKTSTKKHD